MSKRWPERIYIMRSSDDAEARTPEVVSKSLADFYRGHPQWQVVEYVRAEEQELPERVPRAVMLEAYRNFLDEQIAKRDRSRFGR